MVTLMATSKTYVAIYSITADNLDELAEKLSDYATVIQESRRLLIITITDVLSAAEIANIAIKHASNSEFEIQKLALIGPFRKSH